MPCSSWPWPNIFDVARNKVGLLNDNVSIVNRVKLLLLTEPTELYMSPNFGVGLRRYIFTYNNENTLARIRDDLIEQLRIWEPAVIAEETEVTRGLEYTGELDGVADLASSLNNLEMTVTLRTVYGANVSFNVSANDINRR